MCSQAERKTLLAVNCNISKLHSWISFTFKRANLHIEQFCAPNIVGLCVILRHSSRVVFIIAARSWNTHQNTCDGETGWKEVLAWTAQVLTGSLIHVSRVTPLAYRCTLTPSTEADISCSLHVQLCLVIRSSSEYVGYWCTGGASHSHARKEARKRKERENLRATTYWPL